MLDGEAADQSEAWGELKERPFSRVDKARRGAVATLAVLGVFVLLLGPAPLLAPFDGLARALHARPSASPTATQLSPEAALRNRTPAATAHALPGHVPGRLTMSAWQEIALPPAGHAHISVAALPLHPDDLVACAAGSPTVGPAMTGPLRLWRSGDLGGSWTPVSLPRTSATSATSANTCALRIDPDNGTHLAVVASITDRPGADSDTPSCAAASAYFSADGGSQWQPLALPASPAATSSLPCDLWVTTAHLYWFHYARCPGNCPPLSHLDRSDDGGARWRDAGVGLPSADFVPVWSSDAGGESFDVWVVLRTGSVGTAPPQIWTTHDAGHSWRLQGSVTGASLSRMLASHEPSWRHFGFDGVLYDARIGPPATGRVDVLTSEGGRPWYALPPLPLPGAARDLHSGITRVLGVGTGGNLLVLGGPPDQPPPAYDSTNAATPPPTPAWLWEWDRAAQRWRVSPFPVPFVAGDIAISWGAGNTFGGGGMSIQDGYGAYIWVLEQVSGDSRLYQAFVLAQ